MQCALPRENKFLQQVYLPGEEVESETYSGSEGGPGLLPNQGPSARVDWVIQAKPDGG